tara:strand:- start:1432 stop:1785 length:354 start_codon:yes stop_codon:yes gene_type:complete
MIVTKQNHAYISAAISVVTGRPESDIVWRANSSDELFIVLPERVNISAVEAQISVTKATVGLAELRKTRDRLIAETDWWMMPDRTATDDQTAYRQSLRDITDTYTSLEDVVWPEKPE